MRPGGLLRCAALVLLVGCGGCGAAEEDESRTIAPGSDGGVDPASASGDGGAVPASAEAGVAIEGGTSTDGGVSGGDAGGADGGSAPACVGSAADPAAAATVGSYIDKLTGTKPTGAARTSIIDTIIRSCHVYSPPASKAPGWKREYCWAHLVSAISKESSYNAAVTVDDAYSKRLIGGVMANDPIVGLLQIRFSSTVHDYVALGNLNNLACTGCMFPASFDAHKAESGNSSFWGVTGPSQNLALMKSVECNVALGAWYYYVYATGNGKASAATQLGPYCNGMGTAANITTGLRSHLEGPDVGRGVLDQAGVNALQTTNPNAYGYITAIKSSFDKMIVPLPAGTHPFFLTLSPNPTAYCR